LPLPQAPNPNGVRAVAQRLAHARRPVILVSSSGRNPETVPALVTLCERVGVGVVYSTPRAYHSFPMNHSLHQDVSALNEADFVLVIDAAVPWIPGTDQPPESAYVAVMDADPIRTRIPTYEFTANLRLGCDPLLGIEALSSALSEFIGSEDTARFAQRNAFWAERSRERARVAQHRRLGIGHLQCRNTDILFAKRAVARVAPLDDERDICSRQLDVVASLASSEVERLVVLRVAGKQY